MRKRLFMLSAAAIAAGLTALGTVVAQQPGSGGQNPPGALPVAPANPNPPVKQWGNWSPNSGQPSAPLAVPPGYAQAATPPAGSPGTVTPVSFTFPAPTSDSMPPTPGAVTPPATTGSQPGAFPAPTLNQIPPPASDPLGQAPAAGKPAAPTRPFDPVTAPSGFGAPQTSSPLLPVAPATTALPPSSPAVPLVPTVPSTPVVPQTQTVPATPTAPVVPTPTAPFVPPTVPTGTLPAPAVNPEVPAANVPVRPTTPAATPNATLPGRVVQNVVLDTVCPESVVYGQEFRYELIVRNPGEAAVHNVRVDDELPSGAKYVGSDPPAELNGDRLFWALGAVEGHGEKRIVVRVKPSEEGEIRSRATVSYSASVDAKTKVTRPRISVGVTSPEVCRAGEETVFQIKVANSGSGPAQRMILTAKLSDGLVHPQGTVIEAELTNLPAGETRAIPLKVSAAKAGLQWCQITVSAEGSQDATGKASVNVVEPMLQVSQTGPAKCHVRAEPSYEVTLSNPGTAPTEPISLYCILPESFEYVQANDNGTFVPANRAVVWKLPSLPAGGTKTVSLKLRAVTAGDGMLRTIAQAVPEQPVITPTGVNAPARPAGRALDAKTETAIKAEGVAAIKFEVCDIEDPVEVGKEAIYEIKVTNQGTGACTNVQLVASLAEGTSFVGSTGTTTVKAQGQHLVFEPIQQLSVKGEAVYRVRVRSTVSGDLRFRVQLTCDQVRTPVIKEESTSFYKE